MPTGTTVALIVIFVLADFVFVGAVIAAMMNGVKEFAARFPARPHAPGAVRREFQSIGIDYYNLGFSVHITVDESCLHIEPAWLMRRLGMPRISIPWEAIELKKRGGTILPAVAKVGKTTLKGPDWCLKLAGDISA